MDKTTRRKLIYILKNENKTAAGIKFVIEKVNESGGLDYATKKMENYRDEALEILNRFNPGPVRDALEDLVRYTTDRKY